MTLMMLADEGNDNNLKPKSYSDYMHDTNILVMQR